MTETELKTQYATRLESLSDDEFQSVLLQGVSRTFALTIPQLPEPLYPVVANAYLLCRIVDTIEDEVSLSAELKQKYCKKFISVVANGDDAQLFASQLAPLLSDQTISAEHELIANIPRVVSITQSFARQQHQALAACVETMAGGMPEFQNKDLKNGLTTMQEMDRYCYYVAGCVGEMLSKLFCLYSPTIAVHEKQLLPLAISFGQGLQMTNILKDIWDDYDRGVCWLPQEIFQESGYDLANLSRDNNSPEYFLGLEYLIHIAHEHLSNALTFTLLIPKQETGIRYFCLWAIGMAVLTLRKIKSNLEFSESDEVKISRRAVKATVFASRITGRNDTGLKLLFSICSIGLSSSDYQSKTSLQSKHLI